MATGLWTAVSGASAQSQAVDAVANNLANADTLGFKKDAPAFKEYLAVHEREHGAVDIPRGPIKDKDFYPIDGRDQSYVVVDGTYSNFKQGALRVTQGPLDVALDGPGFFEISTPTGIRYTRHGSFKTAPDGRLVTAEGNPILADGPIGIAGPAPASVQMPGQPAGAQTPAQAPASRFINLSDAKGTVSIAPNGEIYSGDQLVAKLAVREFKDPRKLRKQNSLLFENPDAQNFNTEPTRTLARQGMLEASNVNPAEEMTSLIKANRQFEQSLKAMKTYGDMMSREANDIGKL